MKQTAVEWLKNTLYAYLDKEDKEYTDHLFTKAKQIEKEQNGNTWDAAIKAHENRGGVISRSICDFDEYYNERYEGEKWDGKTPLYGNMPITLFKDATSNK